MTNPYRALCAELLSALENEGYAHWVIAPDEDPLCQRARAALSEPELTPTLKEEALAILATAGGPDYPTQMTVINTDEHILIRRALEALPDDIK